MIDGKGKKKHSTVHGRHVGPKKDNFFTKRKRSNNIYKNNNIGIKMMNNHPLCDTEGDTTEHVLKCARDTKNRET